MIVARTMRLRAGVLMAFALAAAFLSAFAVSAQTGPRPNDITVDWIAEEVPRDGETLMTALYFRPRSNEWHGYWSNPGDAGLGMQPDWRLPEGWTAGEPLYPVPSTLRIAGLMNHIYKGDHVVLVPLRAGSGEGSPRADLDYLACTDEICVPQSASVTLQVPQGGRDTRFDEWRAAIAPDLASEARFAIEGDVLRVAIPLPEAQTLGNPHLFIGNDRLVEAAGEQVFYREGDMLVAELPLAQGASTPEALSGILAFDDGSGEGVRFAARPGPVPAGLPPIADDWSGSGGLALLLGGALLGGLLLNIMPCVFPILSLKALALVRVGVNEREARADGLAYTAGAVIACIALGAIILLLRAGGEQIGWAFQLQEPAVVVALLVLATAITANFLGAFELPSLPIRSGGKPAGAFATGVLAAFVATPCTGPFMAAALGAALLLPAEWALAMFAALGLGLALPFLLLGFVPALRRRLPRPGAWMVTFRRWMALPMGLTAIALLWLTWRVGGPWFAALAFVIATQIVFALMALQSGTKSKAGLAVAFAATTAILLPGRFEPPSTSATGVLDAEPFSQNALVEARATGAPVFIWFTADWCLTCKVNERIAIERETTREAFEKAGVVALRGDWTRREPEITRFLTRHGAAGVPLYLWYEPGAAQPEVLPQVLTPAMLTERAAATRPSRPAIAGN